MTTLEQIRGIDPESPRLKRAELLADNDRALLRDLVSIRESKGLSQADVGRSMGISQPSVAAFERYDSNPKLSTIRRYAHAVGAVIRHEVVADEGEVLSSRGADERLHEVHDVPDNRAVDGASRRGA